jgi:hypothetical protein
MKDAYNNLFRKYNKDTFFKDSLEEIIYIDEIQINNQWKNTIDKLKNNQELFIRGYGRDAAGTKAYITLYKHLFNNDNIRKDPTNNDAPTKIITNLTGLNKTLKVDNGKQERIQNYQVSHLFGKTKNPLLFTAAWNIAYIPKYIDPFTGHETQGDYSAEFKVLFDKQNKTKFSTFIKEYNSFVDELIEPKIEEALRLTKIDLKGGEINLIKFESDARNELKKI